MQVHRIVLLGIALCGSLLTRAEAATNAELQAEVTAVERAFAQTMADRDQAAFARFVADDAIFINGEQALRGKAAVLAAWQPLFAKPTAPFSWQPQAVEVNDAGDLAISRGPVRDAAGKLISGFSSIWRRERSGVWKIVFDQGTELGVCASGSP